MPVRGDTYATRRHLPHLEKAGKTYFVTFATLLRRVLEPGQRDIVHTSCLNEHELSCFLECFVVMPDHVHLVLAPYPDVRLPVILQRVKSVSAHRLNRLSGNHGALWQDESFDRILRTTENLRQKCEYVCNNPVRAGLVSRIDDYPWVWRGGQAPSPVPLYAK